MDIERRYLCLSCQTADYLMMLFAAANCLFQQPSASQIICCLAGAKSLCLSAPHESIVKLVIRSGHSKSPLIKPDSSGIYSVYGRFWPVFFGERFMFSSIFPHQSSLNLRISLRSAQECFVYSNSVFSHHSFFSWRISLGSAFSL